MIEEIWKAIPNFDGYEVSNLGQVRSFRTKSNPHKLQSMPHILSQGTHKKGYKFVSLQVNSKQITIRVHRLVMLAFVGPCPDGLEVCHSPDSDKTNNHLANLRYDTRISNIQDSVKLCIHGKMRDGVNRKKIKVEKSKQRKQRIKEETRNILEMYSTGKFTMEQIGKAVGLSISAISRIVNGSRRLYS